MDWRNSKSVKYFLNIQHIWATPPWFRLCVTQFRERRLAKIFSALYFVISIFNSKLLQTKCCDNNFCQMNTPITILQGTAHCGIPRIASKMWRKVEKGQKVNQSRKVLVSVISVTRWCTSEHLWSPGTPEINSNSFLLPRVHLRKMPWNIKETQMSHEISWNALVTLW